MQAVGEIITKAPEGFLQLLLALDYFTDESKQLVIAVPSSSQEHLEERNRWLQEIAKIYCPNKVVASAVMGNPEDQKVGLLQGKTCIGDRVTAYLCQGHTCKAPVTSVEELLPHLKDSKTYSL